MKVNALEYTVTDEPDGKLKALRYGEEWRCCIGDNLILSLAMQLEDARNYIAQLEERCEIAQQNTVVTTETKSVSCTGVSPPNWRKNK
jgi:hypothetical protein